MACTTTDCRKTAGKHGRHWIAFPAILTALVLAWGCGPTAFDEPLYGPPRDPAQGLVGTWVRPIPYRPDGMEGIRFDPDGRFGLIGIHTMSGLQWRLEDREVVVTTVTERYPEPFETRLTVQALTDATLVLEGDEGYFRSVWHRDDAAAGRITGRITYRERMALPPEAVVLLRLEDVSRQDGAATFVAGQVLPTEGRQVPIPFVLYYEAAAIDPRKSYQVRADIVIDGRRRFLTALAYPALTRGNPHHLDMNLQSAPPETPAPALDLAAPWRVEGMTLPATYAGRLSPPAGGPLSITLNLYANRLFFLRKQQGSTTGGETRYDHGRWYLAHGGRRLMLVGQAAEPYKLAVRDHATLRLPSLNGREELLQAPVDLALSQDLDPFADGAPLTGMFRYMADAALFTDCLTGTSFPVAQENDYLALERAYLEKRREPGEPLHVALAGHLGERPAMEGDGLETVLVVDRFDAMGERSACPVRQPLADLETTYWKLTELYGQTLRFTATGRGEPHLILRPPERQLMGFSGCNGFFGLYLKEADRLSFSDLGATMMACPGNPDLEATYYRALKATEHFKIFGELLELYHGREVVARFEAVDQSK